MDIGMNSSVVEDLKTVVLSSIPCPAKHFNFFANTTWNMDLWQSINNEIWYTFLLTLWFKGRLGMNSKQLMHKKPALMYQSFILQFLIITKV